MALPLGTHAFLRLRNSSQRTAVLNAVWTMLNKGGSNDVIIREDLVWSDVQTTEGGSFDWSIPDGIVTAAAAKGIKVLWILNKPPAWATAPGGTTQQAWTCAPYADVLTAGGNSALDAYAAFCAAAVARYARTGTFWQNYDGPAYPTDIFEVLNEEYTGMTGRRWISGQATVQYSDPEAYAAIYNKAAAAIHTHPYAQAAAALVDRIWNSNPIGGPYIDIFLGAVTERIDVASVHNYPLNYDSVNATPATENRWAYFTAVDDVRAKLDKFHFYEAKVWITEIGWPGWPSPTGNQINEATQAARFSELWSAVAARPWIHGLVLFNATNPDCPDKNTLPGYDANNQENFYAFWRTGTTIYDIGTAKPVVTTVTNLPAIPYTPGVKYYFAKPSGTGDLPSTISVHDDSLPARTQKTPFNLANKALYHAPMPTLYNGGDVTWELTTTAPTYTNMWGIPWNTPSRFRYGGKLTELSTLGMNQINGATAGSAAAYTGYTVECWVQGNEVAFQLYAIDAVGDYLVLVEAQPITPTWQHFTAGGGYYLKLTFTTKKTRKIRIMMGATAFAGAWVPATGDVWETHKKFTIAALGDSFLVGPQGTSEGGIHAGAFAGEIALRLGADVWNLGQGGTGYVNPGNGTTTSPGPGGVDYFGAATRLGALAQVPNPDLIMVWGGANDAEYPLNTILTRANSLWSAVGRLFPGVPLIVGGPQSGVFKNLSSKLDAMNNRLKTAAAAHPDVVAYVDQRNPMWVDGTGKFGTPTGDGNADFFVSSDGTHPSHAGYAFQAQKAIDVISRNVRI